MADLAIIIPTRGRPGNIIKVIQAWTNTGGFANKSAADLIVVFDNDDSYAARYLDIVTHAEVKHAIMPVWMPMVHKLDRTAQLFDDDYFALGFAGDDHLPRTVGWAARYLAELRDLGTGIVYGDDGYQGEKLCTEWAMTSDIVRALGRMVPAPVEHMYSDVSLHELGQAAGCIRHLPDVKIEHVHPYAGKTEMDAQYKRVNSRQQFAKDKVAYRRWQRREMPGQVTAVRMLRPETQHTEHTEPSGQRPPTRHRIGLGLQRGGKTATNPSVRRFPPPQPRKVTTMHIPRRLLRVRGATPPDIGAALADFATQVPADQVIVELGVFQGQTALLMAWGARQGNGAHVWGIDPWDLPGNDYGPPFTDPGSRNWARYNVKAQGMANQVTLVQDFGVPVAERWDGPQVGMMFIDDDHSYGAVLDNIRAWTPHLADGAVIAFDDYGHEDWPGVKQAVDEMVEKGILGPVQIYHDRLAVTRLGRERIQQGRPEIDYADEFVKQEGQLWTGEVDPDRPCPPPGSVWGVGRGVGPYDVVLDRKGQPVLFDAAREHSGTGQLMQAVPARPDGTERDLWVDGYLRDPTQPAGKTDPVDLDPPPVPAGEPDPAGKTQPVDLDPDPDPDLDVAVAHETVLVGEIPSISTQTTLDQLNVFQLRELAKSRNIMLGRQRKTRDAALAALRAGR